MIEKNVHSLSEIFSLAQAQVVREKGDFRNFPDYATELLASLDEKEIPNLIRIFQNTKSESITNLFRDHNLALNLHYWPSGITNCHSHHFCGAFRVIQGKSLHLSWNFIAKKEINDFMTEGKLVLDTKEEIDIRFVKKIKADPNPHQLIYLERPTFTLVLRSKEIESEYMDEFFYPGLRLKTKGRNEEQFHSLNKLRGKEELDHLLLCGGEAIILGLYSGALVSYNTLFKNNLDYIRETIHTKYAQYAWFKLYLDYFNKHQTFLQKLLMR